jgi:hypothetical protein
VAAEAIEPTPSGCNRDDAGSRPQGHRLQGCRPDVAGAIGFRDAGARVWGMGMVYRGIVVSNNRMGYCADPRAGWGSIAPPCAERQAEPRKAKAERGGPRGHRPEPYRAGILAACSPDSSRPSAPSAPSPRLPSHPDQQYVNVFGRFCCSRSGYRYIFE